MAMTPADHLYELLEKCFPDPTDAAILDALTSINGYDTGMTDFLAYKETGNYNMSIPGAIAYVLENLIWTDDDDDDDDDDDGPFDLDDTSDDGWDDNPDDIVRV